MNFLRLTHKQVVSFFVILALVIIVFPLPLQAGQGVPSAKVIDDRLETKLNLNWWAYKKFAAEGKAEKSLEELEILHQIEVKNGITRLAPYSNALVRNAKIQDDPEQANKIFSYARKLSPKLASVDFAEAGYLLRHGAVEIFSIFSLLISGFVKLINDQNTFFALIGNTLFYLSIALAFAILASFLILTIKYFRSMAHDIGDLLRIKSNIVRSLICGCFFIILMTLPLGLFGVVLLWASVIIIYSTTRERLLVLSIILGFILVPTMLGLFAMTARYEASIEGDIIKALEGECFGECINEIYGYEKKNPNDLEATFGLAVALKNLNYEKLAMGFYEEILNRQTDSHNLRNASFNNLGNLYFKMGDTQKAVKYYESAIKENKENGIPFYNLSQAYYDLAEFDKGAESLDKAMILEPKNISSFEMERLKTKKPNLIDQSLSTNLIIGRLIINANNYKEEVFLELWHQVFPLAGPLVAYILVMLFLAWFYFSRKILTINLVSRTCEQCGNIVCKRCARITKNEKLCSQCYNLLNPSVSGSSARSREKEIQIRKYQKREAKLSSIMSFPFAGIGHLYDEKPLKGFVLLVLVGLFGALLIINNAPIAMTDQLPRLNVWVASTVQVILLVLLVVYSVRDLSKG